MTYLALAVLLLGALFLYILYRLWNQNMSLQQVRLEEKLHIISMQLAQSHERVMGDLSKNHLEQQTSALDKGIGQVTQFLNQVSEKLGHIEKERKGESVTLLHHLKMVADAEESLRRETGEIAKALRHPSIRGTWGELHLRKVVELAGLVEHVDFMEQVTVKGDESLIRPDLIVYLPGKRHIIIDAKAPMQAFLELSTLIEGPLMEEKKKEFARHLKLHIQRLARKEYAKQSVGSADFVVLFLPTESLLSTALNCDPTLYEYGSKEGVLLATPSTLIALLKMVAMGWRDEKLSLEAQEIKEKSELLLKHLHTLSKNWSAVGLSLGKSVEAYNKFTRLYEEKICSKLSFFGSLIEGSDLSTPQLLENTTLVTKEDSSTLS